MRNKEIKTCIECGKMIPYYRISRAITCSKKCSNKRATTTSSKRKK
ncbi:MAG: hypothetical protein IIA85_01620 [Nanoarchaeota archaeon]|nr:hypothetical protein [Nanoarchaeota archaeon]